MLLRKKRGFTLIEILIVCGILGIFAYLAVPAFKGLQESGEREAAIQRCGSLNVAKSTYRNRTKNAATSWAGNDEAKFQLLKAAKCLPGVGEAALNGNNAFMPAGFAAGMGVLVTDKVTLTDPTGANVSY